MKALLFFIAIFLTGTTYSQQTTQTIRGVIRDEVSQSPVIGATVLLLRMDE